MPQNQRLSQLTLLSLSLSFSPSIISIAASNSLAEIQSASQNQMIAIAYGEYYPPTNHNHQPQQQYYPRPQQRYYPRPPRNRFPSGGYATTPRIPICPMPPAQPQPMPPLDDPHHPVAYKPAIYLYPEKPTEVEVFIDPKINLTIDIPKYNPQKGWKVLAYPNGLLEDLQLEQTDPESYKKYLNSTGLEYAYSSALRGTYPYLYWEGTLIEEASKKTNGWIVSDSEIKTFLSARLDEMNFSRIEKKDFLDYWVIKIKEKQKPFYWISFVLTKEFDQKHPLKIVPKPDSIMRVLIEVAPLDEKPSKLPEPQKLESIIRKGFTVLEWGGYFVKK